MSDNPVKLRSEEVRLKLHPDMKRRVDRIAEMHGTPTATWCHTIVTQAVVAFERQYQLQNKTQEAFVQGLLEQMGPQLAEQFKLMMIADEQEGRQG